MRKILRNWIWCRIRSQAGLNCTIGILMFVTAICGNSRLMGQNSNRTQRVQPNELSRKAGSAISWARSLDAAMKTARKDDKLVFWYISTVPGTFMDRKPVIDRYMLGGIFSWPPIIQLINDHFVPVKAVPRADAAKYGVRPFQYIEPGFIILSPDSKVLFSLDRITTLQYRWLEKLLIKQVSKRYKFDAPTWPDYYAEFSGEPANWIDPFGPKFKKNAANLLLSGMIAFRKGDHKLAKQRWEQAAKSEPDHPLAWKASLEAQGIGPFSRGFEVFRGIPDRAQRAGEISKGSSAPEETYTQKELVSRSSQFLLGMQRNDGAFVDSDYDFGGFDSLPNVYVAVSSLVGMALIKVAETKPDNLDELIRAVLKVEQYVTNPKNLNPMDRDEILWAHSYRLRFLSRLSRFKPADGKVLDLESKIQTAIKDLENIQLKTGNWYHEYTNPFVTATALCALKEAENAGGSISTVKVERGRKSLLSDRFSNGSYPYSSSRRPRGKSKEQMEKMLAASAGRMPICELALVLWKEKDQDDLAVAVKNSLEQHRHLASGYKYDNHTSNMAYGGFFFWYDMRSRSEAIRAIENLELRKEFTAQQQKIIEGLPEVDGCFVDSHELGRCYGTAMAILAMEFE